MTRSAAGLLIFGTLLLLVRVCPAEEAGTIPVVERIGKGSSGADLNWQFGYDNAGHITKVIDPAGQETQIHYTLDEYQRIRRMVKELSDASRVVFEFDHLRRRVGMSDAAGTVRYEYDGFNHLTAVRREDAPAISYTYDTLGRLSSIDAGGASTLSMSMIFWAGWRRSRHRPVAFPMSTGMGRERSSALCRTASAPIGNPSLMGA